MATELRDFSAVGSGTFRGTRSLLAVVGGLALSWDARYRQRRWLAQLPDELLADMGISRRDAAAEAERPFWSA